MSTVPPKPAHGLSKDILDGGQTVKLKVWSIDLARLFICGTSGAPTGIGRMSLRSLC